MNRHGFPTLEERLGSRPGQELRELLGDATAAELVECVAGGALDGFVALCGGKERFKREGADPLKAAVAELTRLKFVLRKADSYIENKIAELVD